MNKERMNIRAAIKEKDILDRKIESLSSNLNVIESYSADSPYIGLLSVEAASENIVTKFQSLNDMIKRREAINKGILAINAVTMVTVKKFISFEALGKVDNVGDTEEISLANAINRKNYYKGILNNVIHNLSAATSAGINRYKNLYNQNTDKINRIVKERFAGQTNYSQSSVDTVCETESKKYKVDVINPLQADTLIPKLHEYLEDYVQVIDNLLSAKSETTFIDIEY